MGNIVIISDGDGKQVGHGDHGLGCFALAGMVGGQATGKPMPIPSPDKLDELDEWLNEAIEKGTPAQSIIMVILMCDESKLTVDEDLEALDEAIRTYPESFQNGPKKILEKYRMLLNKHGTLHLRYSGDTCAAFTITSHGINPE
jgi:hypothetical protein